ncbi:response regulator [Massilia sp. CF038]|uniref:response regulator n=1 Tax=Massilia sp. CF038 TaxID=1881045 RepID=UPI00090F2A91|nr:response regulator [Massilia sp. CF038]SHG98274.1 PAS domain S-box-containing protein [Massilia sp. CF038]
MLACLLPSLIGFAALTFDSFNRERSRLLLEADRISATLLTAVERDLDTAETAARALASSPSLAAGNLADFHMQARSILRPELPATGFVLSDRDGRPLLDTRVAYGRPLAPNPNAETIRKAFAGGDVLTSDLYRNGADAPYHASVEVPVWRNGEVAYILSAQLSASHMTRLLEELRMPATWHASILDSQYRIVTRSRDPQRWMGKMTHPDVLQALAKSGHGMLELVTRDGLEVILSYTRSDQRGWVANIGVPRDAAYAGVRASMSNIILSVGGLMAVGFFYAWVIGGRIRRSVRALCAPAQALGRGEPVEIPPLRIREAAEVATALQQVEAELQRYRTGLEERVRERTEELHNAYALLENVYATAPAGLALLDCDLRVVMVNDYLARINARTPAEHIGRTLPELLGPIGVEYERAYRQVRDTGQPLLNVEGQGDVPYDPGVIHHWLVSYHPVYNSEHKMVGVSGLVLDVSETKRLTAQLRDISEQFHVIYEMSGDAHLLVSPEEGYVGGNRAAAAIFGCSSVEQFLTLSPAATSPEFQPDGRRSADKADQFMRYALERGSHQFEWLHQRVDGTLFHADVILTSLNSSGKPVLQVIVRDISERIAAEARMQSLNEQLVHAVERAETANRAKSEFLANMSHEIRTPMNAIMGLARLLEESPLARRERGYVAKIKMSTRSLLGILNDVLDFSKIEAGQMRLEYTSFRIDQVLDSISVLLAPNAASKGLELVYDVAPDVPVQLVGDPMRLEQVLLNLVSNAIKFTERGEVVLAVRRGAQVDEQSMTLVFSVRDSGIGIAPEQHSKMFNAFSQADSSTSRKYGGTGLGLTICKRLVGLMGGTIEVHSALGQGAEFVFDAAFGIHPGAATVGLPDLPGLERRSVLVVDDNPGVRASIAAQCSWFGWRVETAASGSQALELLRAAKGHDKRYDFLLLDAAMPELDGISVLTYAQADRSIALPRTALMVGEDTRAQLDGLAGDIKFDAVLSKPFTRDALVAAIVELHTGRPQLATGQASGLAGRLEGIYVLLVEDNQINQEVANYLLLHAGAAVDIAADGKIAVDMLSDAPTRYDAVLMDIQMPVMNGYEATRAIRSMGLADLPIIAMTANVMEDDRARAIEAGMNGHISKPIDVDNLVSALLRVTSGGDVRELREAPRSRYRADPGAVDGALPAQIEGIDLRSTLPRFGGNFANFVALFKRFEQSQGGTLAEVRQHLRSNERDAAVALMHRLRGVAANLGATEFAGLALEFEQAVRKDSVDILLPRLDLLEVELAKLMVAARELQLPDAPGNNTASADSRSLDEKLANLLGLLQNNNLKALAEFDALRGQLAALAPAPMLGALADAIATLAFANAARQLKEIMDRRVTQ